MEKGKNLFVPLIKIKKKKKKKKKKRLQEFSHYREESVPWASC